MRYLFIFFLLIIPLVSCTPEVIKKDVKLLTISPVVCEKCSENYINITKEIKYFTYEDIKYALILLHITNSNLENVSLQIGEDINGQDFKTDTLPISLTNDFVVWEINIGSNESKIISYSMNNLSKNSTDAVNLYISKKPVYAQKSKHLYPLISLLGISIILLLFIIFLGINKVYKSL